MLCHPEILRCAQDDIAVFRAWTLYAQGLARWVERSFDHWQSPGLPGVDASRAQDDSGVASCGQVKPREGSVSKADPCWQSPPLAVPRTLLTAPTTDVPPARRAWTLRGCLAQSLRAGVDASRLPGASVLA